MTVRKPPPWWVTYPRRYWTEAERVAAIKDGWRPPAAERRQSVLEEQRVRINQQLPQAPPLFTGPMESTEDYERRQRQQRVARLLAKHGMGERLSWWRL